jgi:hypothetical protein
MSTKVIKLVPAFVVAIITAVIVYNNIRDNGRHYLLRRALVKPKMSAWRRLLNHGDEGSFLDLTGFNFHAFREMVHIISTEDERHNTPAFGRPKLLNIEDELGLYLFYVNSTMKAKHLALLFGVLPSTVNTTILRMMKRIVKGLKRNADSRVKFPDQAKMEAFAAMVNRRDNAVDDVIGFLDGLSMPVQCSDDPSSQAAYYNGYHGDTMINNIFLFSPEGKIIYAVFNAPGSWHDSHVAQPLITVVLQKIGSYKICVDQGFKRGGSLYDKFVGPLSKKARRNLCVALRRIYIEIHNRYVSLRQSSEWGMRALQGTFTRLKSRLTSNLLTRHYIIHSIILLHNFRTAKVGLNQIATVFNKYYEPYINLDPYDRIARYYDQEFE